MAFIWSCGVRSVHMALKDKCAENQNILLTSNNLLKSDSYFIYDYYAGPSLSQDLYNIPMNVTHTIF